MLKSLYSIILKFYLLRQLVLYSTLFAAIATTAAQELKVKSFTIIPEVMIKPMQRKDANGNICALVKVIIPNAQASFEGNLIGPCEYKTSEYWCYLSPESRYLRIKYPGAEPLLIDFENFIGAGLKSKTTYELFIELPPTNHGDVSFTIKGKIEKETPNEKGLRYGEKLPYTPGYILYKNYHDGKYEGKWEVEWSYEISGIRIGDVLTLLANDQRYEPQTIVIKQEDIGNTDFNFYLLKKKVNLKGYLVDMETGEAITGTEVSADNKTWYKTDDYGYFTLENLIIDKVYKLYCRNEPYGYLTYEKPSVIPMCSTTYGWGLKRNKIYAWVELNGIDASEISARCNDGHEATIETNSITIGECFVKHPLHSEKPSLILKAKGYKTIRIDYGGYLGTPKPIKFHKGDENEVVHYVTELDKWESKTETSELTMKRPISQNRVIIRDFNLRGLQL